MEWKKILELLGITIPDDIQHIVVDSREVGQSDLFIAINSGHLYVDEALNRGAWVLSSKPHPSKKVFQVKDTVYYLGLIAKEYRKSLKATVIGVTGSVGKTSLTQFLKQALPGKVIAPMNNFNNEIGLPLTILKADQNTQYLVCEMGVSKPGDMDYLADILRPNVGMITHIGPTHLQWLKDNDGVWKEKRKLAKYSQHMIMNLDAIYWPIEGHSTGYGSKAEIQITGSTIRVRNKVYQYDLEGVQYRIYIYAASHALFNYLGLKADFSQIKWPKMRMEVLKHISGAEVIMDCYNANLLSYIAALDYISKKTNFIIVLGGMTELGHRSLYYHGLLGRVLNKMNIDFVAMYGKYHTATMETFLGEVLYFDDKRKLKIWLSKQMKEGVSILVKGGRSLQMEEVL